MKIVFNFSFAVINILFSLIIPSYNFIKIIYYFIVQQ